MRRLGLFIMLAFVASAAGAQALEEEIKKCAAEQNSLERLTCFDRFASSHKLAPATSRTTVAGAGKWETRTDTDPLTDKAIHMAGLYSSSTTSRPGRRISLAVRCKDNSTEMWISWDDYLGSDSKRVTYRIDKEPAKTSNWDISTNNKSTFFPGSPVPLLKRMVDSTSFVANVMPYNESPVTAVFETDGADKALADIRKGCGW